MQAIAKSSASFERVLNVPQFPGSCCLERRVTADLANERMKNKSSARRRQQEAAGRPAAGGAEVVRDESHLCLTLSDKTVLDTYGNDPLSECNAYSPSPGCACFVCAVNTERAVRTRARGPRPDLRVRHPSRPQNPPRQCVSAFA